MRHRTDPRTKPHPDPNLEAQRRYHDRRYQRRDRRLGIWLDTEGKQNLEALLKLNPNVTGCVHYALAVTALEIARKPPERPRFKLPDQSPSPRGNKARWRQRAARWLTTTQP